MSKKLFVGSLPYSVNGNELEDLFAQYGKVDSAIVISDRVTGRSKGFGFVEMSDNNEANAAMQALNGRDMNGRQIVVSEAKERSDRGEDRGDRRRW
ncbi:MAG: hypothetical protein K0S11_743 [Gammaproteobacteria bacterium]|jgi:RNA recognition motif-containing protein|nr:hypothetical protein [Gammaproteobacteria bacterium]